MRIKIFKGIKNRFLAGITVIIPGAITIFVIVWLLKEINKIFNPFSLFLKHFIGIYIPDAGLIILFIIILGAGFLVTNWVGRAIVNLYENVMLRIPFVSLLYKSMKQWVNIFSPEKNSFKKFVLVKYGENKYVYGFLTSTTNIGGKNDLDYFVVYIPTNHLYIGVNIIANKNDIIETGIGIDEGIQIVLSAGIAFPASIEESKPE